MVMPNLTPTSASLSASLASLKSVAGDPDNLLFQSPPGSGGNDGALPTQYDPRWSFFTNLTTPQILAFQSMPQALKDYLELQRWRAELSGTSLQGVPVLTDDKAQKRVSYMKQAFDAGVITAASFQDGSGNLQILNAAQATAIYAAVAGFVEQVWTVAGQLITAIDATPPTVTTRKQIDAAIAAVAPNSASAKNPWPN